MPLARTAPLRRQLVRALPQRPFAVEFWDGTRVDPTDGGGPTFRVRSPRAVAHALRAPGQLGIGRAYVSGELEVDDIDLVMELLEDWRPPAIATETRLRLLAAALAANGLTLPPAPPRAELQPQGARRTKERDARSVRHHYDLPPEFFSLFLDESMTYSCAIFSRGAETLEEAQEQKLEMVCAKLALEPGERILDIGCGWGSFATHAASRHGVDVVGITLSEPQARVARERAEAAGVGDKVDIRVMDYRDLAGEQFEAIASIGMVEHVGARADRPLRRATRCAAAVGRAAAQPRHRPAPPQRPRGGPVLGALRLPRRRPAAPLAGPAGPGAGRLRSRARRGLRLRLRRDAAPLGPPPRRQHRPRDRARRPRAGPRLAPLPARRPQRLRERLHLDLPGPRPPRLSRPRPAPFRRGGGNRRLLPLSSTSAGSGGKRRAAGGGRPPAAAGGGSAEVTSGGC